MHPVTTRIACCCNVGHKWRFQLTDVVTLDAAMVFMLNWQQINRPGWLLPRCGTVKQRWHVD